jgi:hypothetical protein
MILVSFFLSLAQLNVLIAEEAPQSPSQTSRPKSAMGESKTGLPDLPLNP